MWCHFTKIDRSFGVRIIRQSKLSGGSEGTKSVDIRMKDTKKHVSTRDTGSWNWGSTVSLSERVIFSKLSLLFNIKATIIRGVWKQSLLSRLTSCLCTVCFSLTPVSVTIIYSQSSPLVLPALSTT